MKLPKYIKWFVKETVTLEDETPIICYRLDYEVSEEVYCDLALHIRQHYESDEELENSIEETEMAAEEYLIKHIIPQKDEGFGPTARSNDFTEIMISDLFEFIYGFTVPRCKQRNRSGKNQSEHGTDILAYKLKNSGEISDEKDHLLAIEVKSGISSDSYQPIVTAVTDSIKFDEVRHTLTLNYYRKKLRNIKNFQQAKEVARFQKKSEKNYLITYIAAAIISRSEIEDNIIIGIRGEDLELRKNNKVFLVHGDKLMDLVHEIYERCIR